MSTADGEWPQIDPTSVCPTKDGRPNMYSNMPTRFVQLAEAKYRGWKYFYIGDVCSHGHKAPRFVSNPRMCVDCDRARNGQALIGGKGAVEYKTGSGYKERAKPELKRALEPSKLEKDFLAAYADVKDFDEAAKRVSQSPAIIESRLAWSTVFREAYDALEDRIGVHHVPPYDLDFEWDEDKRGMLIRVYVDTGDIATARDAIRVSPFEYQLELQRNAEFAAKVTKVQPLAYQILEERATQDALKGNDKLLTKILTARVPGFDEKIKVDVNDLTRQTPEQVSNEIVRLFAQVREIMLPGGSEPDAIDVHVEVVPTPQLAPPQPVEEDFGDLI